jgi:ABC-type multidrug transport system fused ATPase/permease subunit
VACVLAVATAARFYLVSWLGERVTADLRSAVYAHVVTQSPQFFETTRSGEVLSRLTADTTLIQAVVGTSISMALRNALLFAGGMTMLFITSVKLTSIILITLLAVVLPIVVFGRRVQEAVPRSRRTGLPTPRRSPAKCSMRVGIVQAYTHEAQEARRFGAAVEDAFQHRAAPHPRPCAADDGRHPAGVRRDRLRAVAGRACGDRGHDERRPARPVHPVFATIVAGAIARVVGSAGRGAARRRRHRTAAGTAGRTVADPSPEQPSRARRAQRQRRRAVAATCDFHVPVASAIASIAGLSLEIAPARRWPSSARPAPARPRCSSCCCASTIHRKAAIARWRRHP